MTIPELYHVAIAIQEDIRHQTDRMIDIMEHGPGGGGGGPPPPPARNPLAGIADTLGILATRAGVAQNGLSQFIGTFDRVLGAMGAGMARFVQLANPAVVFRFNMAVENAMSAVGRVLVPVMERFTLVIQGIGNAIDSLSPVAKNMIAGLTAGGALAGVLSAVATGAMLAVRALGPIPTLAIAIASAVAGVMTTSASGKEVMESFSKVMAAFGQVVEVVAHAVMPIIEGVLVPAFQEMATAMLAAAEGIKEVVNAARELAGFAALKYDPNAKTATAVRTGGVGDLRGYANRAYTSAFNSGASSTADKQLAAANTQTGLLREIRNLLGNKNFAAGDSRRDKIVRGAVSTADLMIPGLSKAAGLMKRMAGRLF